MKTTKKNINRRNGRNGRNKNRNKNRNTNRNTKRRNRRKTNRFSNGKKFKTNNLNSFLLNDHKMKKFIEEDLEKIKLSTDEANHIVEKIIQDSRDFIDKHLKRIDEKTKKQLLNMLNELKKIKLKSSEIKGGGPDENLRRNIVRRYHNGAIMAINEVQAELERLQERKRKYLFYDYVFFFTLCTSGVLLLGIYHNFRQIIDSITIDDENVITISEQARAQAEEEICGTGEDGSDCNCSQNILVNLLMIKYYVIQFAMVYFTPEGITKIISDQFNRRLIRSSQAAADSFNNYGSQVCDIGSQGTVMGAAQSIFNYVMGSTATVDCMRESSSLAIQDLKGQMERNMSAVTAGISVRTSNIYTNVRMLLGTTTIAVNYLRLRMRDRARERLLLQHINQERLRIEDYRN